MNAKHTPTPWAIHNHFFITAKVGNRLKSVVCEIDRHAWTNSGEAQANAEHIVHCVNMHNELVEALKYIAGHAGACLEQNEIGKKQGLKNCISKAMDVLSKAKE